MEVLKVLCTNTNKNALRNKAKSKKFIWKDIEVEEMKKFLGMLLYMALVKLPKRTDFWRRNNIFHLPFPSTVMPRDRFMAISDNLHMSDLEEDAMNDAKKGTEEYDPLHRLKPLLEMIRNRCTTIYHPKQHISVDERMVATKARVAIKLHEGQANQVGTKKCCSCRRQRLHHRLLLIYGQEQVRVGEGALL